MEQYPGCVVEAVTDSSRYFVVRIEDGNGKMPSQRHQQKYVTMQTDMLKIYILGKKSVAYKVF